MACSGLKTSDCSFRTSNKDYNSTRKILNLAFKIMSYVKTVTWGSQGSSLSIKIGIHYGNVIAGVIGYHKPQFSLIGDTVNTTSRVCSTGIENSITLSEEAYNQVKNENDFKFTLRTVEAKGKGILNTYQTVKAHLENKLILSYNQKKETLKNELKIDRRREKLKSILINEDKNSKLKETLEKKQKLTSIYKLDEIGANISYSKNDIYHTKINDEISLKLVKCSIYYEKSNALSNPTNTNKNESDKVLLQNKQKSSIFNETSDDLKKISISKLYEREKPYLYMEEAEEIEASPMVKNSGSSRTFRKGHRESTNKMDFDMINDNLHHNENVDEIYQKLKIFNNFFLDIKGNDENLKNELVNQIVLTENKIIKVSLFLYMLINLGQFITIVLFNFSPNNAEFYFNIIFRTVIFFWMLYLCLSPLKTYITRKNLIYFCNLIILVYLEFFYYSTISVSVIALFEYAFYFGLTIKMFIFFQEAFIYLINLIILLTCNIIIVFLYDYYVYPEMIFILTVLFLSLHHKHKKQYDSIIKFNEEKQSLNIKNNYNTLITNLLPMHVN